MATYGNNPYGGGSGGAGSMDEAQIRKWYLEMLGREAGDEEVTGHLGNPGGMTGVQQTIAGSPEGLKYGRQTAGQSIPDEWKDIPTAFQSPSSSVADWAPPAAASGADTSRYAPRLTQQGDRWSLTEHGNVRPLQPNEVSDAQRYVTDFWTQFPTGFQDPSHTNADYQQTYTTYGPGAQETGTAPYTPQAYAGDVGLTTGFNRERIGNPDDRNEKYIFARATAGLEPSEATLDEVVRRLQAQGINAKRVGMDQIDFGTGEGPVDVLRNKGDATRAWQWLPLWDEAAHGGGASSGTSAMSSGRGFALPQLDLGLNDLLGDTTAQQIITLLQDLSKSGYPRDLLLQLLKS